LVRKRHVAAQSDCGFARPVQERAAAADGAGDAEIGRAIGRRRRGTRPARRLAVATAAGALVLGLAAAGCGSSGKTTSTGGNSPSTTKASGAASSSTTGKSGGYGY